MLKGFTLAVSLVTSLVAPLSGIISAAQEPAPANEHHAIPFTSEYRITEVKTLANGTRITRERIEVNSIDSQGRTMSATTVLPTTDDGKPHTTVEVTDPIAETTTHWDTRWTRAHIRKKAQKESGGSACETPAAENAVPSCNPAPHDRQPASSPPAEPASPPPSTEPKILTSREDLGEKTIFGLQAHGTLVTRTIPADAIGNDEPLVSTREKWWASTHNVGLTVRAIDDDPQTGKRTQTLEKLKFGEPDPATFQPPPGYHVEVEQMQETRCGVER
jgi:hypothetical protein